MRCGNINRALFVAAASIMTVSCTSSMGPFNHFYENKTIINKDTGELSRNGACSIYHEDLQITLCQLRYKISEVDDARGSIWNDPILFDLPLLGLAGATAGLLLYDAGVDGLAGVGLGASLTLGLRQYLAPSSAKDLLGRASSGYTCLVSYGEFADQYDNEIIARSVSRETLFDKLGSIRSWVNRSDVSSDLRGRANNVLTAGEAAIDVYDKQYAAARTVNPRLRMSAHNLGKTLIDQADRDAIDYSTAYQSLLAGARSVAEFDSKTAGSEQVSGADTEVDADAQPILAGRIAELVSAVTEQNKLLSGLVNLEAIVLGFDQCVSTAIAGGVPPQITPSFARTNASPN